MVTWRLILTTTRALGAVASVGCIALWMMLITQPHAQVMGFSSVNYTALGFMTMVAVAGAVASAWGKGLALGIVSAVSFVPAGFYLMLTPSKFRWIGWLNLLMLLAALLMGWANLALAPSRAHKS
jgi:hypothetical protein